MQIEIINSTKYRVPRKFVTNLAKRFLRKQKIDMAQMAIHIVSATRIRKMNARFRKIDKVTDVLSFPQVKNSWGPKSPRLRPLGDIFICYEQMLRQAKNCGRPIEEELLFLIEHGLKHLVGIHHK